LSALRILVVTGIFPPDIGGPANYVPGIAQALLLRGHHVRVVTLADNIRGTGDAYDFPVDRIQRQQPRLGRMFRTIARVARLGREADVLFLNGLVLEGVIASMLCRKPAVVKVVGDLMWERAQARGRRETLDEFQHARLPFIWRLMRTVQSRYMRAAARIITPSRYLKSVVVGWGVPDDRVNVVYNAVEAASDEPDGGTLPHPAATFDVVTVGRLVPWKGIDALIRICARHGWRLLVVGDGPLKNELQQLAQSTAADVTFCGSVAQKLVAGHMQQAKVFVLNSTYEGLPHIVLEAKVAGVPVIATAVGGTPECIDHDVDGLLVPSRDDTQLESAIARVIGSAPLRDRLVANARAKVREAFGHRTMVDGTEAILRQHAHVP
jgi:glycosyltransferase involved in cell wall biosynthesis